MKKTILITIILLLVSCSREQLEKFKELQEAQKVPIEFIESNIRVKDNKKNVFLRMQVKSLKSIIKDGAKNNIGHLTIKEDTCFLYNEAKRLIWRIQSTSADSFIIRNVQDKLLFELCIKKNYIRMMNAQKKELYALKLKSPRRAELYRGSRLFAKAWVFGQNIKLKNPKGEVLATAYNFTNPSALFLTIPNFSLLQKSALCLIFHRPESPVNSRIPF